MVKTIVNNNDGMSIRKALAYSGCSKNTYYYNNKEKYHGNHITAATAAPLSSTIEKEIQQISLQRPTYGTRRMAAMLTRILGRPVNRKRVQRIFSERWATLHTIKKEEEIIRSKIPNIKADRPNQVWEADLTYIHCGIDGWGLSL